MRQNGSIRGKAINAGLWLNAGIPGRYSYELGMVRGLTAGRFDGGNTLLHDGYKVHVFDQPSANAQTLEVFIPGNYEVIVVGAGGGGGGRDGSGGFGTNGEGGGAGAYISGVVYLDVGTYNIYVGGRGASTPGESRGTNAAGGINGGGVGGAAGNTGFSGGGGGGGGWTGIRDSEETDIIIAGGGAGGGGGGEGSADNGFAPGGGIQSAANGTSYSGGNGSNYGGGDGGGYGAGGGGRYGGAGGTNHQGGGNYVDATIVSEYTITPGANGGWESHGAAYSANLFDGNVNTYGKGGTWNAASDGGNGVVMLRYVF